MTKCYSCERGTLNKQKRPFSIYGVLLGSFDAEVCPSCGEAFYSEKSSEAMDVAAKKAGVWGLEATTNVGQVGNSLDVKINKQLANFMKVKKGDAVRIYPDGTKKIVIELK